MADELFGIQTADFLQMWCFNLQVNLMYVTWWRSLRDVRSVGKSLYSSTKENKQKPQSTKG